MRNAARPAPPTLPGLAAACDAFLREHSRGCPLCALAPGGPGFGGAMRKLDALFDAHAGGATVTIEYETVVHHGEAGC
jgi:hypothetical protein